MNIGHKIFELGMKRFSGNADFVLCYVDFMSHLNEDNNTRVLYERALGSDEIPPERTRSIWSRFLQFELQASKCINSVNLSLPNSQFFPSKGW